MPIYDEAGGRKALRPHENRPQKIVTHDNSLELHLSISHVFRLVVPLAQQFSTLRALLPSRGGKRQRIRVQFLQNSHCLTINHLAILLLFADVAGKDGQIAMFARNIDIDIRPRRKDVAEAALPRSLLPFAQLFLWRLGGIQPLQSRLAPSLAYPECVPLSIQTRFGTAQHPSDNKHLHVPHVNEFEVLSPQIVVVVVNLPSAAARVRSGDLGRRETACQTWGVDLPGHCTDHPVDQLRRIEENTGLLQLCTVTCSEINHDRCNHLRGKSKENMRLRGKESHRERLERFQLRKNFEKREYFENSEREFRIKISKNQNLACESESRSLNYL